MRSASLGITLLLAACGSDDGSSTTLATSITGPTSASSAGTSDGSAGSTSGDTAGTTSDGATTSGGASTSASATSASTTGNTTDATTGDDAPPRIGTMKVYLDDAIQRATDIDAGAQLVQINGMGMLGDGTVDLEGNEGFVRRWNFGFTSGSGDISVIYMSEDWAGDYPEVEHPAGNVTEINALPGAAALPDSDAVISAYQGSTGCTALSGSEQQTLLYRVDDNLGGLLVQVNDGDASVTWGATVNGAAFDEWDAC